MLEPDARKRPKNMQVVVQRFQYMQRDPKKIIAKHARSLLWGLLIGSFPYSLFLLHMLVENVRFLYAIIGTPTLILAQVFFSLWPLIVILQILAAILLVFTPGRRLIGIGIVATLFLILCGLMSGWPLVFFASPV
jgi:hypothetical protein